MSDTPAAFVPFDYTSLITSEHRDKPRFMATLTGAVALVTNLQGVLALMSAAYDLDLAIGVQLDAVGAWVGVSRIVSTAISGVYFAWDTAGLGWEQGVWKGQFDPSQGITTLDDETYRLLIRAKIAANSWDGTVLSAITALNTVFASEGITFQYQDNSDMTAILSISGAVPNALFLALFSGGYIPLKPVGVRVNYLVTSSTGQQIFGWDVTNAHIGGWDVGAWAVQL